MSLVPAFEIGVWNAWTFMSVFLLQWLAVALAGNLIHHRTGHPPDMKQDKSTRIRSTAATITWVIATLYSIFLPLRLGTPWFYTGLAIFLLGLTLLVTATLNFATASADQPVTSGIYRYSRHPMYLSMLLIYLGVSLACASWLFLLITVITFVLQRLEAILEENYCLGKYGNAYRAYMNQTPRWAGVPRAG